MQEAKKNLGVVVRAARIKKGYTQDTLVEALGLQSRTILEIENGRGNPRFDVLFKLVRLLDISPDDIFYFDRTPLSDDAQQFFIKLSAFPEGEQRLAMAAAAAVLDRLLEERKTAE